MFEAGYWVLVLGMLVCGVVEYRICQSMSKPLPGETSFVRDWRLRINRETKGYAWIGAGAAVFATAVKLWG